MVSIQGDPGDPTRVSLTVTVSLYIDRLLVETLSNELEQAIQSQAIKDIKRNKEVKRLVAEAASAKLLQILEAGLSK